MTPTLSGRRGGVTGRILGGTVGGAVVVCLALASSTRAAEPLLPSVEWQARAENVAGRIGELIEYGKAYGDDDAKLADAVAGLRERAAAKKTPPPWIEMVTSTATLGNVVIVDWYANGSTFYALATYAKPVVLAPDAPWIP